MGKSFAATTRGSRWVPVSRSTSRILAQSARLRLNRIRGQRHIADIALLEPGRATNPDPERIGNNASGASGKGARQTRRALCRGTGCHPQDPTFLLSMLVASMRVGVRARTVLWQYGLPVPRGGHALARSPFRLSLPVL